MSGPADRAPKEGSARRDGVDPSLRYACEDCAYFVADLEVCAHGYPTAPHRKHAQVIVFCKEFELA